MAKPGVDRPDRSPGVERTDGPARPAVRLFGPTERSHGRTRGPRPTVGRVIRSGRVRPSARRAGRHRPGRPSGRRRARRPPEPGGRVSPRAGARPAGGVRPRQRVFSPVQETVCRGIAGEARNPGNVPNAEAIVAELVDALAVPELGVRVAGGVRAGPTRASDRCGRQRTERPVPGRLRSLADALYTDWHLTENRQTSATLVSWKSKEKPCYDDQFTQGSRAVRR